MIYLSEVSVAGQCEYGPFVGILTLVPGLQVISARNAYGKSLAATTILWCLGLEPMLGLPDNDASCFPEAARELLELDNRRPARVLSSQGSIVVQREDGNSVRLTRPITGERQFVDIEEMIPSGPSRRFRLLARQGAMSDATGGLQAYLFGWLGWPREQVATFDGKLSTIYLENLAPLFFIEQDQGWTDVQARQVTRYRQQQIFEIAVEYLLGATDAVEVRVRQLLATARDTSLRDSARAIADRINTLFLRHGWAVDWSGNGSVPDVLERWSSRSLKEVLRDQAEIDFSSERTTLAERAESLRRALTQDPVDTQNISAPGSASQRAIELKTRRHELNANLRTLRMQFTETEGLLESLEHRIVSARDLYRLKKSGVGRLEHVECPTCHRDLDPSTFHLTEQSAQSVEAHIEGLKRDRELVSKNVQALQEQRLSAEAELVRVDEEFREAERALATVNLAVGTFREQITQTALTLATVERQSARLDEVLQDLEELQHEVDHWVDAARAAIAADKKQADPSRRRAAFLAAFRRYLLALGHSAVSTEDAPLVEFNEQYVPLLNRRRLRFLGSGSDPSRLIAAYTLALAAASAEITGLHPGVVVLDEPLQQNPDAVHRQLFTAFLQQQLTREAKFQTIIFTWLRPDEISELRGAGVEVLTPEGDHFLKLQPPALPQETAND